MEKLLFGPKLDFMVKMLWEQWQWNNSSGLHKPGFDLTYKGSDNELHRPVMIHRAHFVMNDCYLLEHTAGNFPLWLMPEQAIFVFEVKYEIYAKKF
jgi:threonyl-tRNA synthetase